MNDTEIKFEREDLEGIIPIGTYLADAARRMGIELWHETFDEHEFSVVKVTKGGDLLSAPTKTETKYLNAERIAGGERVAEQAKIEQSGEISIMTTKKPEEVKPDYEAKKEEYRKEFEELPLEKKIASLVELEAIALGETFNFIINSPYALVGKLFDVLAGFGRQMDADARKNARPEDHQTTEDKTDNNHETQTKKTTRKKNEASN